MTKFPCRREWIDCWTEERMLEVKEEVDATLPWNWKDLLSTIVVEKYAECQAVEYMGAERLVEERTDKDLDEGHLDEEHPDVAGLAHPPTHCLTVPAGVDHQITNTVSACVTVDTLSPILVCWRWGQRHFRRGGGGRLNLLFPNPEETISPRSPFERTERETTYPRNPFEGTKNGQRVKAEDVLIAVDKLVLDGPPNR